MLHSSCFCLQGHLGSPLLCKSSSSWFQVAIVTVSGSKSARADIQVFEKASKFGSFLKEMVDDLPSPAAAATGNTPSFAIYFTLIFTIPISSLLWL